MRTLPATWQAAADAGAAAGAHAQRVVMLEAMIVATSTISPKVQCKYIA